MHVNWSGIYPAVTTQFETDQSLDLAATLANLDRLLDAGMDGLILLGTAPRLSLDGQEREAVLAIIRHSIATLPCRSTERARRV